MGADSAQGDIPFILNSKSYQDLKMRVRKAIPNPFATWQWWVKASLIFGLAVWLELHALLYGPSLGKGAVLGVLMAMIGLCIQHDANHGAVSPNGWVNRMWGYTQVSPPAPQHERHRGAVCSKHTVVPLPLAAHGGDSSSAMGGGGVPRLTLGTTHTALCGATYESHLWGATASRTRMLPTAHTLPMRAHASACGRHKGAGQDWIGGSAAAHGSGLRA